MKTIRMPDVPNNLKTTMHPIAMTAYPIGLSRKIDTLGRVTIPVEYREYMKLKSGDAMEVLLTNKGLLFRKGGLELD